MEKQDNEYRATAKEKLVGAIVLALFAVIVAVLRGLIPSMGDTVPVAIIGFFGTLGVGLLGSSVLESVKDKINRQ